MFAKKAYPRHSINLDKKILKTAAKYIFSNKAISGGCVEAFERKFANYIGVRYAVGVSSARKGLYLILKSLNFSKNDEVIMPSYTFHPLPMVVIACGLKPVFVDVNPDTYNIDFSLIEQKINKKTAAIIVTHMFGQPCDMDPIKKIARKFNLVIIEDCAHACGAKYNNQHVGLIGDVAIFSFNRGKNLPCFSGGMITTMDSKIYTNISKKLEKLPHPRKTSLLKEVILTFIFYCVTQRRIFSYITYPVIRFLDFFNLDWIDSNVEEKVDINSSLLSFKKLTKLANLQAAVGIEQLQKLDTIKQKQKANAQIFIEELRKTRNVSVQAGIPNAESTYLYFRIRVPKAKIFRKKLLTLGVDTKRDDMSACSALKVFEEYKTSCPVAERISTENIEIPNNPLLGKKDVLYIIEQVKFVAEAISKSG